MKNQNRPNLAGQVFSRWPMWLVLACIAWFAITRFPLFKQVGKAMEHGQLEWLIGAALAQVLYYWLYGVLYWSAFRSVGVEGRTSRLIPLVLGSLAGGTAVGATIFINDAVKRGQSSVRAAAGTMLVMVSELSGVALLTLVAIGYLYFHYLLKAYQVACAAILVGYIAVLTVVITAGFWRPETVEQLTTFAARFVNGACRLFKRPPRLSDNWAYETSEEIIASAVALRERPRQVLATFGIALVMFAVSFVSVGMIFYAFHQPIVFGPMLAGFALGMLFWVVTVTPQGLGLSEFAMAGAYASLGVPQAAALLIALTFRGLALYIPVLAGVFFVRSMAPARTQPVSAAAKPSISSWTVYVISIMVGLMGVIDVISAILPDLDDRVRILQHLLPDEILAPIRSHSHIAAALAGFALLMLARGLWRRKRAALVLSLIVLAVSIVSHLLKGLDYYEALLASALAGWLVASHSQFYARSDQPSVRNGLIALGSAVAFTIAYGTTGFYLLDNVYVKPAAAPTGAHASSGASPGVSPAITPPSHVVSYHNYGFRAALKQTIEMFTDPNSPDVQSVLNNKFVPLPPPAEYVNRPNLLRIWYEEEYDSPQAHAARYGRFFAQSIYWIAVGTGGYAFWMLLMPVLYRSRPSDADYDRAKEIVLKHGKSSLAACALFDDKNYFFTEGGSVVQFAVKSRMGLALGDPIGPEEDAAAAIAAFRDYCARNDWGVTFYQALPDYVEQYKAAGFSVICIGHEAIVNLEEFTILGGANKTIRWSVNHLTKLGFCAELLTPPHPVETMEQLRSVSDDWLAKVRGREKRFSLGWFDDKYIQKTKVMVVRDPNGDITAFANIQPEFSRNEVTVDLMRSRREIEVGTMDMLFVRLLEWAKAAGYDSFNLGLSPLSGVGEQPNDQAIERGLRYIYENINQFYKFKGLHTFKGKFHPEWSPRYLVYSGTASLPRIAFAIISANSGDDFLWSWLR